MGYSKMEKEDQEEIIHRRAQFLIYKVLQQADFSGQRKKQSNLLGIRISKMKVKIGNRLRKMRKKMMSHLRLSSWKRLFGAAGRLVINVL
ncbi:uncharacterized protein G2W53_002931 [Senna tora]|uniref:Uncharacterized protein n=1 Tax=Senna tora TaxID=362788 RepID=A0A834XAE9_9FABA|nr:uncharacterized protein G2W53_002931 [Senna tora]